MSANSYREQYDRMIRSLVLLEEVYDGVEHGPGQNRSSDYYEDRVYLFYQSCYHLKDWMKNDNRVTLIVSESDIERFVNSEHELRICGDICNGSKHSKTTTPKVDPNTNLKNTERKLALSMGQKLSARFNIECGNKIYDALKLARNCVNKWNKFITKHKLPV